MKHDYIYNHLNALEFLIVNHPQRWKEILNAIESIDANNFIKASKDKTRKGEILYNQVAINDEFKKILSKSGWKEMKTDYYVTGDIPTAKDIVKIKNSDEQKEIITGRGFEAFTTYNQVDFLKDRIAVEVQFGKYFSVAYDLHVKHTFFFLRDEIDVGIEIIPTHAMMRRMDTGVAWFENEVANVVREGRNNPSVPIVIIGIEPEELIPETNAKTREEAAKKKVAKLEEAISNYDKRLDKEQVKFYDLESKVQGYSNVNLLEDEAPCERRCRKIPSKKKLEEFKQSAEKANAKIRDLASKKEQALVDLVIAKENLVKAESDVRRCKQLQERLKKKTD